MANLPSPRGPRGVSLIEAMISVVVISVGLLGLFSAQMVGARQNTMAARHSRAMAVARDTASAITRWGYDDPRLDNAVSTNDATVTSSGALSYAPQAADYDLDLNANGGASDLALSNTAIDFNGDGQPDFQRYLSVSPLLGTGDLSTVQVGKQVVITVAWLQDASWQSVTLYQAKYDMAGNSASIPGL